MHGKSDLMIDIIDHLIENQIPLKARFCFDSIVTSLSYNNYIKSEIRLQDYDNYSPISGLMSIIIS